MSRAEVVDRYFLEHRAKLIDVAAFLDRLDRTREAGAPDDYRVAALRKALGVVAGSGPERARRVLELLSDPSATPIASAAGMKGAFGACDAGGGGGGG